MNKKQYKNLKKGDNIIVISDAIDCRKSYSNSNLMMGAVGTADEYDGEHWWFRFEHLKDKRLVIQPEDCKLLYRETEEDGPTIKEQFNSGKKFKTRDGYEVTGLSFDKEFFSGDTVYGFINNEDGHDQFLSWDSYGNHIGYEYTSSLDIIVSKEKHEGWVNIYARSKTEVDLGDVYKTKEEAIDNSLGIDLLVDTVKIEWED